MFKSFPLNVDAIRGEVVGSRCCSAEGRVELLLEREVLLELSEGQPLARRGHGVRASETALGDELLGLTRVRLVLNALRRPANDPVEDESLARVLRPRADARLYCALVVFLCHRLKPVKVFAGAGNGEIITVNRNNELLRGVPEDAR